MAGFLLKRVLEMVPVVIGITLLSFLLIHLVPGDPVKVLLGPRATPANVASLRDELNLNRSLIWQYGHFIKGAATLSFGQSITYRSNVGSVLSGRVAASFFLILYGLAVGLTIALPLAFVAALRRDRLSDNAIRVSSTFLFAMPSFWLGLLLIIVFGLKLGWFPTSGYGSTPSEHFRSLTLPAITIGLYISPVLLRLQRSSLIDTLDSEFVEATRARGISEKRVLGVHVLRNSLTSTITFLGIFAGVLLSGAVVVENVFSIPGMGSLLVDAVTQRDYPVVQALTLIFGLTIVVVSLITDVAYAIVDPRVRL
jgi:peptide/nickel transport system permease protein